MIYPSALKYLNMSLLLPIETKFASPCRSIKACIDFCKVKYKQDLKPKINQQQNPQVKLSSESESLDVRPKADSPGLLTFDWGFPSPPPHYS